MRYSGWHNKSSKVRCGVRASEARFGGAYNRNPLAVRLERVDGPPGLEIESPELVIDRPSPPVFALEGFSLISALSCPQRGV